MSDLIRKEDALTILLRGKRASTDIIEAIAALPAVTVGVKPLVFSEFREGGCCGRPHAFQYFVTQNHNGRFLCHHDQTWHDTLEAAQAHAQAAYQVAALDTPAQPAVIDVYRNDGDVLAMGRAVIAMHEALAALKENSHE